MPWDHDSQDCTVTFSRDSLYVIGGDLTIEAKGKLVDIPDIRQDFTISTDTLAGTDTVRTKWIRIDSDLSNDTLKAYLSSDQARAIAWEEGAGSLNQLPNRAMPRWNHYWHKDQH